MIGSISSQSAVMPSYSASTSSSSSTTLTTSQKELISSVLEEYDADNLSAEDAQSIVSSFQDAGIVASSDLEAAMEEAGFSAQEVGQLANVGQQGGGMPPPPAQEEVSSVSSLLDSLLSTDEDEDETSTSISSSFDEIMDYTSRILSLNDESKDEVMSLLDKYSSEDSTYSKDETSSLIKNSLSQILSDSNNYKNVSFYG
jgi:hypothetical protein